jgi:hypothetical protein
LFETFFILRRIQRGIVMNVPKIQRGIVMIVPKIQRGVVEKLTGSQQLKKFPTFYGTRRLITSFTSARQLFLS